MEVRAIWVRFRGWLRNRGYAVNGDFDQPPLNDDGMIIQKEAGEERNPVQTVAVRGKPEMEKFQAGFETLVDKLQSINDHLNKQVVQHENLMARIEQFPKLLESFPAVVDNQKLLSEQLVSQLKAGMFKDQQLLSAVERIPMESAKQTDVLAAIDRQLTAAADVDIQMTETFGKFNESIAKLSQATKEHTNGLTQMSRTFAASDRFLKFMVARQTRQMIWIFYSALGICVAVILILVCIILFAHK